MKLKYYKAELVSFFDLSEEWQKEAKSNLDELAEETYYIEPSEDMTPDKHILWDISEAMYIDDNDFNACINISNNSAMLLNIDECFSEVKYKFV